MLEVFINVIYADMNILNVKMLRCVANVKSVTSVCAVLLIQHLNKQMIAAKKSQ